MKLRYAALPTFGHRGGMTMKGTISFKLENGDVMWSSYDCPRKWTDAHTEMFRETVGRLKREFGTTEDYREVL